MSSQRLLSLFAVGIIKLIIIKTTSAWCQVMGLVELQPLRQALVGLPGVSGLSVEQRKRLTIAVELVANPSAVFMVRCGSVLLCKKPLKRVPPCMQPL